MYFGVLQKDYDGTQVSPTTAWDSFNLNNYLAQTQSILTTYGFQADANKMAVPRQQIKTKIDVIRMNKSPQEKLFQTRTISFQKSQAQPSYLVNPKNKMATSNSTSSLPKLPTPSNISQRTFGISTKYSNLKTDPSDASSNKESISLYTRSKDQSLGLNKLSLKKASLFELKQQLIENNVRVESSINYKRKTKIIIKHSPSGSLIKSRSNQINPVNTDASIPEERFNTTESQFELAIHKKPSFKEIPLLLDPEKKTVIVETVSNSAEALNNSPEPKTSILKLLDLRAKLQAVLPKLELHIQKAPALDSVEKNPNIVFADKIVHQKKIRPRRSSKVFLNNSKTKRKLPSYKADKQFAEKSSMLQRKILQHIVSKRAQNVSSPTMSQHRVSTPDNFEKATTSWLEGNFEDQKPQKKVNLLQQQSTIMKISAQSQGFSSPMHQDSLKPLKFLLEAIGENQHPEADQIVVEEITQERTYPRKSEEQLTSRTDDQPKILKLCITSVTNHIEKHKFQYPKHHVNSTFRIQSLHAEQMSQVSPNSEEKIASKTLSKKDNIYALVSKAMIHKKYVRRFKSCLEDIDLRKKEIDKQPQLFISPQNIQQYTKYYIQNQLIKTLEKTSDYDFDMIEALDSNRMEVNEFKRVNNLYKDLTQMTFRSETIMSFNKTYKNPTQKINIMQPSNIVMAKIEQDIIQDDTAELMDQSLMMVKSNSQEFQNYDQDPQSLKNLLSQQFDMVYLGAVFSPDKIKKTNLVPLLGELSEVTRNKMLELSKKKESLMMLPIDEDNTQILKSQEIQILVRLLPTHELSQLFKNKKKKYETIINGLYEDEIVILVNDETKHIILSCLDQASKKNQDKLYGNMSFKSSLKTTTSKVQTTQDTIQKVTDSIHKVALDLKKNPLSISIPKPSPINLKPNRSESNSNSDIANLEQQQECIKQVLLSPLIDNTSRLKKYSQSSKNLFLDKGQQGSRKAKKSMTRITEAISRAPTLQTPDHMNVTKINQQQRATPAQIERLHTQLTVMSQSTISQVKKNQQEPSMDKYSLVFRSMLISKSQRKDTDVQERIFRAVKENRLQEIEEIAVSFNFINYNYQDQNGNTFLIFASQAGYSDIVSFLLMNGADPQIKNNRGETAITKALEYSQFHTADLLFIEQRSN